MTALIPAHPFLRVERSRCLSARHLRAAYAPIPIDVVALRRHEEVVPQGHVSGAWRACRALDLSHSALSQVEAASVGASLAASTTVALLTLRNCLLSGRAWMLLCNNLGACSSLTAVDLKGSQLGSDGANALRVALTASSSLISLNLVDCDVGTREGCAALAAGLLASVSLQKLNVSAQALCHDGARAMVEVLGLRSLHALHLQGHEALEWPLLGRACSSLACLEVCHNSIAPKGLRALAEAIGGGCLVRLCLIRCKIGPAGCAALHKGLVQSSVLSHLDLSCNAIGEEGALRLSRALETSVSISTLVLARCQLSGRGLALLGQGIGRSSSLQSLDLSHNRLALEGASVLARAVAVSSTLSSLKLVACAEDEHLGPWVKMSRGVEQSGSLRVLDLSHNVIGTDGVQALGGALAVSASVNLVNLAHCNIGPVECAGLCFGAGQSRSLTALDLSHNGIARGVRSAGSQDCLQGLKGIRSVLASSTSLTDLDLFRVGFSGPAEWEQLGRGVEASVSIARLCLSDSSLCEHGAETLGQAICANSSLHTICLDGIAAAAWAPLWRGVQDSVSVVEVHIEFHSLPYDGARAMGRALAASHALKCLRLAGAEMGAGGWPVLCRGLEASSTLSRLHLSGCFVGDDGSRNLGAALAQGCPVTSLKLLCCNVGPSGCAGLSDGVVCV